MSSSSKIFAATEGGHHLLKIENYSSTKSAFPNGQAVKSHPFSIGGHPWSILYYPNGMNKYFPLYVSLYLVLEERVASPVTARVQLSFAPAGEKLHGHLLLPCFPKKTKTAPVKSVERKLGSFGSLGWAEFIERADLEKSRHLVDDSFTLRCEILVINGFRAEGSAPAVPRAFVTVPPSDLGRCLRGLLETGSGADATFEVAGETFSAHRWLLVARSPTFSAELLEQGGVVRVDKMDPQVFKALLSFMYTDSLSLPETATKQEESALAQHLLVAAHRYGMERLKLLCEERLCKDIDVGTAASILALAEPLGCRGLKDACFDFLGRSPANLKAVMASDGFAHLSATCPSVLKELVTLGSARRLVQ
jgi:speckle-type POZ protein